MIKQVHSIMTQAPLITLIWILQNQMVIQKYIKYINSVSLCDGGFGGWGRERPVKQRVAPLSPRYQAGPDPICPSVEVLKPRSQIVKVK
jgi:hypothetical protein